MARTIKIDSSITVGALAEKLEEPVSRLITELMKNGVLATVNERIDFDTASIIVGELGIDVELVLDEEKVEVTKRKVALAEGVGESRPPVVAVMGHVDHGKTSLLDAITNAKVASGEAGGITQHISASQTDHNGRLITFLDTPGHEAFAAIREHGAHLTDLVVLVVAADDGIKPQTLEAIRFAKKAGVKILVAINKIDKDGADVNRVKQELSENELMPEEWGGETVVVEVSAKTKQGLDNMLDMVLLVADVEDLRADESVPATGLIIEAHMEQGRGPVAIALVESGILRKGAFVVAGGTYAKIRNLESTAGIEIAEAKPSTPVVLTGFKSLPRFGDEFVVMKNEKEARTQASKAGASANADGKHDMTSGDLIRIIDKQNKITEMNIIVKADVQGSLKSVIDSLRALNTDEVAVRVVGTGVGNITEKDIHLASTSNAIIYAFNSSSSDTIKKLASRDEVSLRSFNIIYELIDDCKRELSERLEDEVVRTELGRLLVKGIFKISRDEVICGGEVTKGIISVPSRAIIFRGDDIIADVVTTKLQRGPQETKEVQTGEMCGVSFSTESRVEVQEGDRLEFYKEETVTRTL